MVYFVCRYFEIITFVRRGFVSSWILNVNFIFPFRRKVTTVCFLSLSQLPIAIWHGLENSLYWHFNVEFDDDNYPWLTSVHTVCIWINAKCISNRWQKLHSIVYIFVLILKWLIALIPNLGVDRKLFRNQLGCVTLKWPLFNVNWN